MKRRVALAVAALGLVGYATPAGLPALTATPAPRQFSQLSEPEGVLAGPATATGSLFTFSSILAGKPVRWNPCAAIHWQFRPNGAPASGLAVAKSAVARIAQATGTTWVYDGAVSTAPTTAWLPKSPTARKPVLIGWSDAAHSDLLAGKSSSTLGVTRTVWFGVDIQGVKTAAIRGAVVALNASKSLPATGPVSWKVVLLHELGHAMGLGHAGAGNQLMYPVLPRTLTGLQSGDLQGLLRVGRPAGCVVVPGF